MGTELPIDEVLHGDCVEVMDALPARCADLVFADPPYNLQLNGDLWRPNNTKVDAVNDQWDRFASFAEYDAFTRAWLTAARRVLKDTGTLWVIGTYHNIYRVGAILQDLGYWLLNDVAWVKVNPMPQMKGVRFCNAHETLLWAKKSQAQAKYTFNYHALKAANEDKQVRSDWRFPLCSGAERVTVEGEKAHSTQKPEALLRRVIAATSRPGDVVLDPFCGTGTTAVVAKRLGRHFLTIEREERYVRLARERLAGAEFGTGALEGAPMDAKPPRVPFLSLVEAGHIPAGTELHLIVADARAVVQPDGTVAARGHRGSIHKVGALCLGLPACNGWTQWRYRDPATGELRLLDALRREVGGEA